MNLKRDLVGYGLTPPRVRWPNGAAVAVSLVVNFEEGAELAIEAGDETNERIGEIISVVREGTRDFGQEQIFSYGMRAGLRRYLDAFERHQRHATFFMCGRAIERVPQLAREVVTRGHEPACHGWRWRPHSDYASRDEELADLRRCIAITESVTGERPAGFFCRGSPSIWTRELLTELSFEYDSNAFDDDLPYWNDGLLTVPYALDCNDMKFFHPNGFACADEFVKYTRDGLETLIAEGRRGLPQLLNIGFHLRICGRPSRFAAVERILEHLATLGDAVWVARRIDIARHWKAQFPK